MADFDPAAPASYQFWTRPVLRFGDLDTVGHVNNVASIAMIEDCRVRFYRAATENAGDDDPLPGGSWVARKLEVDFIAEILWPGDDLAVGTAATRFGNTSVTLHHGLFVGGACAITAITIGVRFDTAARAAVPISPALKAAMAALSAPA
ncbi:MAG: thioesterase family protein [Pseudomonadota bacterium]|nr:thioesterase family protein [Pseudomonadota bacterium]MEC8117644.1 thioesterase family protein [Pseudomonadota bacterium]